MRFQLLLQIISLTTVTIPVLAIAVDRPAIASSDRSHCVELKQVKVCAEVKDRGYHVYTQLGLITSQKQYIDKDRGMITFGGINFLGKRDRVEGSIKFDPLRLEGKVEVCQDYTCRTEPFILNLTKIVVEK